MTPPASGHTRVRAAETPQETAARLRAKHEIVLSAEAREPLPKQVFDDMWVDDLTRDP